MSNRNEILNDLIFLRRDLVDIQNELSKFPWDSDKPLVTISKRNLSNVLRKALDKEISFEHLVKWANTIECRDDIDFETDHLQEVFYDLANPEINGEITKEKISKIVNELE